MRKIKLTKEKFALVDDGDFKLLSQWKWSFDGRYAKRAYRVEGKLINIRLHRFLLKPAAGLEVDHINGDKLDNRRSNLRICTHRENSANIKGHGKYKYKGVTLTMGKRIKKWEAQLMLPHKKRKFLGRYNTPQEAAKAYNEAALEHFGEYARLNQI